MDNRIFNVNGRGSGMLLNTLKLVFKQEGMHFETTCSGWQETKENGLILCWSKEDDRIIPFPSDLNAKECFPFVKAWLDSDFAKTVKLGDWCDDADHDGHNEMGWQVYCEDWGHVGGQQYSICAVRPAYLWMGK